MDMQAKVAKFKLAGYEVLDYNDKLIIIKDKKLKLNQLAINLKTNKELELTNVRSVQNFELNDYFFIANVMEYRRNKMRPYLYVASYKKPERNLAHLHGLDNFYNILGDYRSSKIIILKFISNSYNTIYYLANYEGKTKLLELDGSKEFFDFTMTESHKDYVVFTCKSYIDNLKIIVNYDLEYRIETN